MPFTWPKHGSKCLYQNLAFSPPPHTSAEREGCRLMIYIPPQLQSVTSGFEEGLAACSGDVEIKVTIQQAAPLAIPRRCREHFDRKGEARLTIMLKEQCVPGPTGPFDVEDAKTLKRKVEDSDWGWLGAEFSGRPEKESTRAGTTVLISLSTCLGIACIGRLSIHLVKLTRDTSGDKK